MKKIIRLTESDLSRIVRRVIKEKIEDRSKMLGALISPEEYFRDLKMERNKCIEFQKWVKQNYPQTNLGNSGPRRDGVDGICGKLTTAAFVKYGKEFVMEVINGKRDNDDDFNDNGAIPSVRDCQSLFKRKPDVNAYEDVLGDSAYLDLEINGNIMIAYNGTVAPNRRAITVIKDNKPFCKIPVVSSIGDCRNKMELTSDAPGSPMMATLDAPIKINLTGPVAPKSQGIVIKDGGGYFCKIPTFPVDVYYKGLGESRMRRRRF